VSHPSREYHNMDQDTDNNCETMGQENGQDRCIDSLSIALDGAQLEVSHLGDDNAGPSEKSRSWGVRSNPLASNK